MIRSAWNRLVAILTAPITLRRPAPAPAAPHRADMLAERRRDRWRNRWRDRGTHFATWSTSS